jgi:hypothetical protein
MALNTLPAPLTAAELTAKIQTGEFKIKRLPTRRPRKADLIMTRVGGTSMMSSAASDHQTRWQ